MMAECTCFVTPEHTWFRYGSAIEPGSQMEPNPDCVIHFPENACHCGHPYAEHRVSAFGQECAVPCTGRKDYGDGEQDCCCVRDFELREVPGSVRPFSPMNVHPRFAEIQTCVAGVVEGLHRWKCHQCGQDGPPEEDGWRCRRQLAAHIEESHV